MIAVPFIEYLNVRIKGYHSRLFSRETYEDLLIGDNLGTMTTFLLDHPLYTQNIERALEGRPEREGLERGVTDYFARCVSSVLGMAHGKTRQLFEIALYPFDLKNLRTIILAHNREMPYNKVRNMIIPCGSLKLEDLPAMVNAADLEGIVHVLSDSFPPAAQSLMNSIHQTSDKEPIVNLINRLELNFYRYILRTLDGKDNNMKILRNIFRYEIDMKNIATALKFVWEGLQPGQENVTAFIPGGNISIQFLTEMSCVKELDEAFEMVESTTFHSAVEKGIIYFAETGFLHEMERFFEEVFIRKTQMYRRFDPFGVGVFVGYIWCQFVELTNLRTIINGIAFRTGAGQIRKGIIYV